VAWKCPFNNSLPVGCQRSKWFGDRNNLHGFSLHISYHPLCRSSFLAKGINCFIPSFQYTLPSVGHSRIQSWFSWFIAPPISRTRKTGLNFTSMLVLAKDSTSRLSSPFLIVVPPTCRLLLRRELIHYPAFCLDSLSLQLRRQSQLFYFQNFFNNSCMHILGLISKPSKNRKIYSPYLRSVFGRFGGLSQNLPFRRNYDCTRLRSEDNYFFARSR